MAQRRPRGFTVVELLISMGILGLVLGLAVVEFAMVFNHNALMTSNLSADQNARIAMAKVTNEMRQAMPDLTDFTPPATAPPIVKVPAPASGSSTTVTFYRVHNGSAGLNDPVAIPTDGFGNPAPCYDLVSLVYDPVGKTITRTIALQTNGHCPTASSTTDVLARNVTGFGVTAQDASRLEVDLQTTASKGGYGIYDLNTQVTVGYNP